MNTAVARARLDRSLSIIASGAVLMGLFVTTLFLSALLLFSVQPVFAKMVLPQLGGTPAVWAVSMCFFQAVLLAGYCYAHGLNRWVPVRLALPVHMTVCVAAALALPFGLPAIGEPPAGDAYLWLISVLAVGVGLPFFAVSANAPLLQAWFARTGHAHASDPYFLYSASNFGSLIALLAYPFLIEPLFVLSTQAKVWTAGFLALVALLALCGAIATLAGNAGAAAVAKASGSVARPVRWSDRAQWIVLSAIPSGLLVAFSSFVATDIASAPLLWVIPLAIFLLTFMLVFCERPPIPHQLMVMLQPALAGATVLGIAIAGQLGWYLATFGGFAAFFVTTMVCHRELYERRPSAADLTEFYLWMSLGGVIGGVLAAIVAPQIFNALYELPALLLIGVACRAGLDKAWREDGRYRTGIATFLGGAALIIAAAVVYRLELVALQPMLKLTVLLLAIGTVAMLLTRTEPRQQVTVAALTGLVLALLPSSQSIGHSERSFFGVHRVKDSESGDARLLLHGTTLHGIERLREPDGRPVERPVPASYYHPGSPMTLGVEIARRQRQPGKPFAAGIVGLGAGSMACFAREGEAWRFYEIDPVVVKIASDPRHFTFLSTCQPGADIVLGDARLTLAKEPASRFDYLVIDAFSSDAVPVHLLTREAVMLYLDKVTPDGLVALHISNRHLDLAGVAAAVIASIPGARAVFATGRDHGTHFATGSRVMFVSRSEAVIAEALKLENAVVPRSSAYRPWTDDRSDILRALWHGVK